MRSNIKRIMKNTSIFYCIICGCILLFSGCTKENLPPLKCYAYGIRFIEVASGGNPIDSVKIHIERSDIDNGETFDTTLFNPLDNYEFTSNFCGAFKYKIDVYHVKSVFGWTVIFSVNDRPISTKGVNGFTTIENYFKFDDF